MLDLLIVTLNFALPVLITIFLGLFFAGFLVQLGVLGRISFLSRLLVAIAHLPGDCVTPFMISIGSTVAANGMIARFRQDDLIDDKEVFLCAMTDSIPAYVREIFTYLISIVVPVLGLIADSLYAFIFIVTALVKMMVIILLGSLLLDARSYAIQSYSAPEVPIGGAAANALRGQARSFLRIASVYLAMTFLIFLLRDRGSSRH
jgi:hypothetical protein